MPQGESFLEHGEGAGRIGVELSTALRYQPLETEGVELFVGDYHPVAVTLSQDLAPQLPTEKRDVAVEGRLRRLRRLTCPHRFDQGVL